MTTRRDFLKTAAIMPLTPQSVLARKGRPMHDFSGLDQGDDSTPAPRYLDRPLEDWLQAFLDAKRPDQASVARQAMPCFGPSLIGPALEAIPGVERWKRIKLVACIAETGKTAVPALRTLLGHSSAAVRVAACRGLVEALDGLRNVSPIVGRALADVLHRSERLTREGWRQAFDQLLAVEQQADLCFLAGPGIIAPVIATTRESDRRVRIAALAALANLKCEDRLKGDVFHAVVCGLTDPEPGVRGTAAASLYNLMIAERLPVPRDDDVRTLLRVLDDPTRYVAEPIREVLNALPGGPYVEEAIPGAANPEADGFSHKGPIMRVQFRPASRRDAIAPPAESLRSLERKLAAPSAEHRAAALEALGKMKKAACPMENAVILALHDRDIAVRLAAARALGDIGATSRRAAWSLHAALKDSCLQVAASAQLSLFRLMLRLPIATS